MHINKIQSNRRELLVTNLENRKVLMFFLKIDTELDLRNWKENTHKMMATIRSVGKQELLQWSDAKPYTKFQQ